MACSRAEAPRWRKPSWWRTGSCSLTAVLDYPAYVDLLDMPLPDGHAAILDALRQDRLIESCDAGGFNGTNLGAILTAT